MTDIKQPKVFVLVKVVDRDVWVHGEYNTEEEAAKALRKDFLKYLDECYSAEDLADLGLIDEGNNELWSDDFYLSATSLSGWANLRDNVDWNIFEINFPIQK